MASKIALRDIQIGTQQAWHQNTTIVNGEFHADLLGYENEFKPLFLETENGFERFAADGEGIVNENANYHGLEASDFAFNWGTVISNDDGLPAGNGQPVNLETYTLRPAHEDFQLLFSAIEGTNHKVVSMGTVNNRSKHFMSVELDGATVNIGHREFGSFGSLLGSVNKSTPVVYVQSTFCTVCDNTLEANSIVSKQRKQDGEKSAFNGASRITHSKNMNDAISGLKRNLENSIGVAAQFQSIMKGLRDTPTSVDESREIFAGFVGEGKTKLSTRSENMVDSLVNLFSNGRGNEGENRLDVLSAVTEFYTRGDGSESSKSTLSRWQSSEFGSYADNKSRFSTLLIDSDAVDKTIQKGRSLLAAN